VAEEDSRALALPEGAGILDQVTAYCQREIPGADPVRVRKWIDLGGSPPGDRFWTLDPIDGTKGFLRGDQYATALALVAEGQVQLGAIACPNLNSDGSADPHGPGSFVIAVRGQGAWAAPLDKPDTLTALRVSGRDDPSEARMLRSFEAGHTNTGQIGEVIDRLGVAADPVRMDSQAKYCVLAAGGGELLLRLLSPSKPDYREKIWDQAAGSIIVEEAGGRVTDIEGRRLDFSAGRTLDRNRGILASNGLLHARALAALEAIGT
jgi:3'(2'), 5'-bisphosphate nucleotidase